MAGSAEIVEYATLIGADGSTVRFGRPKGKQRFARIGADGTLLYTKTRRWLEEQPRLRIMSCTGVAFQKASEVEAGGKS